MSKRPYKQAFGPLFTMLLGGLLGGLTSSPSAAQELEPLLELGPASHIVIPQTRSFGLHAGSAAMRVESVEADVRILERTARTSLLIALENPSGRQAEAVLLLPVPEGSAVSGFTLEGSTAEPTARLMPREEARHLYDAIVAKLRDPALLEFAGYNMVRSSVFPVPAHGTQRVSLTYEHLLGGDENRVDYLLPRSESLERDQRWRISVDIRTEEPISTVYSPSHELARERRGPGHFFVHLDERAGREPGPFRLSYLLGREGVSASFFAYPDPAVGGGYFLFMAGVPANVEEMASHIKREVTIVLDRSGSMAGRKMEQARTAALQIIEGLQTGEAFNIMDYSSAVSMFALRPVRKSDHTTAQARAYLANLRPAGGTNIHDALVEALRQEPIDSMLPIVLFLTDGLPTVGRTREADIRNLVETGNPHRRRVFTFGIGLDVNAPLLDRIAEVTRATSTFVLEDEEIELKVAQAFNRLYGPVFAEPSLRVTDSNGTVDTRRIRELIPAVLPDLFDGDQLVLLGQYRDQDPIALHLEGDFLGRRETFTHVLDPGIATTRHAFVPRLWASRRIAFLVDQIRQAGGESAARPNVGGPSVIDDPRYQELVQEIVRLSTEFGILSEYTAFLVTDGVDLAEEDALRREASEWFDSRAVRIRSGAGALNQTFNTMKQKRQTVLNPRNLFLDEKLEAVAPIGVQQVADRAFFRRGGRWVDSRLLSESERITPDDTLRIGSDAYLALLRTLVLEGRQGVLALSGEILLQMNGRVILITEASDG